MKCPGCKRDMVKVPRGTATPEGVVRYHGRGRCITCVNRLHRDAPRGRGEAVPVEVNRRHLESWLRARRARGVPAEGTVAA